MDWFWDLLCNTCSYHYLVGISVALTLIMEKLILRERIYRPTRPFIRRAKEQDRKKNTRGRLIDPLKRKLRSRKQSLTKPKAYIVQMALVNTKVMGN
jgi:hypothetical protein